MAAYGTARTYAEVLGRSDVARLLDDSLAEEKAADQKLTDIAEQSVNVRAAEEVHKGSAGILDQSAAWVGSTVGSAASTVRRAARAVGLRKFDPGEAVNTMRDAAAATAESVAETAQSVVRRGRKFSNRAARSAQSLAADVLPKGATSRPQRSKRTQSSRTAARTTTTGRARKGSRKK
jgi:hypothetical protein